MRFASDAKASRCRRRGARADGRSRQASSCCDGEEHERERGDQRPEHERDLRRRAGSSAARRAGSTKQHRERGRAPGTARPRSPIAPNPKPRRLGVSTNCGTRMKELNIPKPISRPVRFIVQIARGAHHPHVDQRLGRRAARPRPRRRASTAAAANRPRMRADVQPQSSALLNATSRHTSQLDSSAAPSQLIRPGDFTGDSGTKQRGRDRREDRRAEREPEQPVVGEASTIGPGEHDAQRRRRSRGSPRSARSRRRRARAGTRRG